MRISEIHLQQQIHDNSKEWLKMIIESYISPLRFYYGVKTGILMSWILGENRFFVNLNTNFCNLADKVLKFRAVIELVSNLMLNYSTYIYLCRVNLKKKAPKYFRFDLKIWHFDIQVYFVKFMYCCYLYIWTLSYQENDVHIINISNGNSIYDVLWYHIK